MSLVGLIVAIVLMLVTLLAAIEGVCWIVMAIRIMLANYDDNCKYLKHRTLLGTWEFWVEEQRLDSLPR